MMVMMMVVVVVVAVAVVELSKDARLREATGG